MKLITIIILIAAAIMILLLMVISVKMVIYLFPLYKTSENPFWNVNNTLPKQDMDKLFTPSTPLVNDTFETRYEKPSDIPDCKYLSGKYMFGMQGSTEDMMLGYMICEGEKPYHYEMILNNVTTRESYWVKREGGSV